MKNHFHLAVLYRIFAATFFATALSAQSLSEEMIRQMHENAAQQIEAQLAQDSADEAREAQWDESWRTSEQPDERATGFGRNAPPPQGRRMGAICMDDTRQDDAGRGACSGHGGVRYWIYQVSEDSTVLYPTERHWAHPEPLAPEERMSLAATYEKEKTGGPLGRSGGVSWSEALLGLMACVTIAYIARLWFSQQQQP